MKKEFLFGLLLLLNAIDVSSQTIIFINPYQANINHTVTTTITGQNNFFLSNPPTVAHTSLYSLDSNVFISPNWVQVIDDDNFYANWTFTSSAPLGQYQLWYQYAPNSTWICQCFQLFDTCRIVPIPANANACQGDSVKLSFMTAATYQWQLNGVNINGANQQIYYAKISGSYTVVVTGCNCPGPTSPVNIVINSIPVVTITPSGTQKICPDQYLQLSTNSGPFYYQWRRNGIDIPFAYYNAITVNDGGSYTVVKANSSTGCYDTSSVTQLNVSTLPITTVTKQPGPTGGKDALINNLLPDTNQGDSWYLHAVAWPTAGPTRINRSFFLFDLSDIPPGSDIYSAELSLYASGTHKGANTAILQRVGASWNEKTITWNNQPPGINSDSVVLPVNFFHVGNQDYLSINVLSLVRPMIDTPSTNYGFLFRLQTENDVRAMLFWSSDNPDPAKRPKLVVKYAPLSIGALNDTICIGDSTQLSIGIGGYNYQWKKNGNAISGATGISYQAKSTGNYTVKLANNFGCSTITPAQAIIVNPVPNAVVNASGPTTFCSGDSVILSTNNSINFTYQWKKNNGNISGAASRKYTAKTAGNYKVKITNQYGCTDFSAVTTVSVPCRNEENTDEKIFIKAFPNPSYGEFNLTFENVGSGSIGVSIYDHLGRLVSESISESFTNIKIKVPGPGLYRALIKVNKESRSITLVCISQ